MKVAHFASWGTLDVPAYTKYFLEQLATYYDHVDVTTNVGRPVDESWFNERGIGIEYAPNVGWDCEKHHQWMIKEGRDRITSYESVTLINDSLICYGPLTKLFEFLDSSTDDYCGLTSSKFPLPHLQLYFAMMRQPMLGQVWDHFNHVGRVDRMEEIMAYELQICTFARHIAPMFPQKNFRGWDEFSWNMFDNGVPLVKQFCLMPRKPLLLKKWQARLKAHAHPDTKGWCYLPLMPDPKFGRRGSDRDQIMTGKRIVELSQKYEQAKS